MILGVQTQILLSSIRVLIQELILLLGLFLVMQILLHSI